ncbi:hypothetical protein Smic_57030 [Streptomyces microflavus]|uniref:Uncharacterized protein n=1 Tax=Streptomyces microflavus TaxID=1919 RepID=A0A7J0CZG3_STRMI|nr:hypothetical protein Smic_57030 [Streptomyces microflavus]
MGRAVGCWVATGALLFVALPADPDGVGTGVLVAYLLVLVAAAADGARIALRSALGGSWRPVVAVGLGVVLLAVPAGGVVAYGAAQDEAREQMLLDRLAGGDRRVAAAAQQPFGTGKGEYAEALGVYRALDRDHPGSRAAKLVPDRLKAYYDAVSAPYDEKRHCEAVEPLTYLRSLPGTVGKELLGELAGWPDGPLAESLYGCGVSRLGGAGGAPRSWASCCARSPSRRRRSRWGRRSAGGSRSRSRLCGATSRVRPPRCCAVSAPRLPPCRSRASPPCAPTRTRA